jgi:Zn-finger nucleic acid-binding protein
MPHFKCVGCRTRLYSSAARADLIDDLCPRCGVALEPVGELAEIVGFQSMSVEAERWLDDTGSASHETVAAAIALTAPDQNQ